MSKELKTQRLNISSLDAVAGGTAIDVFSEAICCKPEGSFRVLENKEQSWNSEGCPAKCKYCWNLKYNDGFYCDV